MHPSITTTYLGLTLKNPIVVGAGPLTSSVEAVRRLEDAGAAAVVLPSLFEEQVRAGLTESFVEAVSLLAEPHADDCDPDAYFERLARMRKAVDLPLIASLNGVTSGGWVELAAGMQDAGAAAIELNYYEIPADFTQTAQDIEQNLINTVQAVVNAVSIPVALKLSPYFTAPLDLLSDVEDVGARGAVLFNRFYQPDIDVNTLQVVPRLYPTDSKDLAIRLRWISLVYGHCDLSLAATGGIATAADIAKAILVGADAVQIMSVLLRHGPKHIAVLLDGLLAWMTEQEFDSLDDPRGLLSLERCPCPAVFERANYLNVFQSWKLA